MSFCRSLELHVSFVQTVYSFSRLGALVSHYPHVCVGSEGPYMFVSCVCCIKPLHFVLFFMQLTWVREQLIVSDVIHRTKRHRGSMEGHRCGWKSFMKQWWDCWISFEDIAVVYCVLWWLHQILLLCCACSVFTSLSCRICACLQMFVYLIKKLVIIKVSVVITWCRNHPSTSVLTLL